MREAEVELSVAGVVAQAEFSNVSNQGRDLRSEGGAVPDAALALPLGSSPFTLGVGIIPESLLRSDWKYVDAPGGADGVTSYGLQRHFSEFIVLRSSLGLGARWGPTLSVGGSVGLIYNRNRLEAPYIFQSQPVLKGFKTLLDLDTEGYGFNGLFGVLYRPHDSVQLGLTYTTRTEIHAEGRASGNASAQLTSLGGAFAGVQPDFRYDAEVRTVLPEKLSAGLSWQAHHRVSFSLQIDWINWADAFDELQIRLTDGDNADLNRLVGSGAAKDVAPLDWKDRFVYRAGIEFALSDHLWLRGGYAYGRSPVPASTLTPLTAAITEHTVTAGVGWRAGRVNLNLAYQHDLPVTERVGTSRLLSGEYNNSRVKVGLHWVSLTASVPF